MLSIKIILKFKCGALTKDFNPGKKGLTCTCTVITNLSYDDILATILHFRIVFKAVHFSALKKSFDLSKILRDVFTED